MYKMIDYEYEHEYEQMLKEQTLDKGKKRGKLKPARQRHNQKQMQVWLTKVPRKEIR
jgi:hypothetical protein